jgi:transcriptional regulator with XRE-family HTH domain
VSADAAGARIARARRRRGLSQSVLAGLVGRSESWLSQVERGKRGVDSHLVLTRMAEVLRVEVEELTGPGGGDGEEGQRVYEPAAEIERAMVGYEAVSASIGGRESGAKATAARLRARASAAYAGYQGHPLRRHRANAAHELVEVTARELDTGRAAGPQEEMLAEKRRSKKIMGHSDLHYEE